MIDLTSPTTTTDLLYGRNSSEDQAEAGTIKNQQQFLRGHASLYQHQVAGEYWDEGVSGTIPLGKRPQGRKLLDAAREHPGAVVLVYRLDRLGRSLRAILDAHDELAAVGVTIKSATEPFDTSTPFGKFMFQFLASLAELDRANVVEKLSDGRDRVAREGRWSGGTVPYGYDVDKTGLKPDSAGRYVPSARYVEQLGMTEAEVARQIIERIAEGSTLYAECVRLNSMGVPCMRRYPNGKEITVSGIWQPGRIHGMVRNQLYSQGYGLLRSKRGVIQVKTPPLIDADTQQRAIVQMTRNRSLSRANTKREYALRALITCRGCGATYTGMARPFGRSGNLKPGEYHYYTCGCVVSPRHYPGRTCRARSVRADQLEALVWSHCARFLRNPGEPLAEARRQMAEQMSRVTDHAQERQRLGAGLSEKEAERERVRTLHRRGRITLAEAEHDLDAIEREAAVLRQQIDALTSEDELARVYAAQSIEAANLLNELGQEVDEIERTDDLAKKRRVIEKLVGSIQVDAEGKGIDGRVTIVFRFRGPDSSGSGINDGLAHVTYWKEHHARSVRKERQPPWGDVNARNRIVYELWRDKSPEEVVAYHRAAHAEVMRTLAEAPDEWFSGRQRGEPWPADLVGHVAEHRVRDVERALSTG